MQIEQVAAYLQVSNMGGMSRSQPTCRGVWLPRLGAYARACCPPSMQGVPTCYWQVGWNRLDFCIVVVVWLELAFNDVAVLRVLRLARCLRPLRIINHNPGMQVHLTPI